MSNRRVNGWQTYGIRKLLQKGIVGGRYFVDVTRFFSDVDESPPCIVIVGVVENMFGEQVVFTRRGEGLQRMGALFRLDGAQSGQWVQVFSIAWHHRHCRRHCGFQRCALLFAAVESRWSTNRKDFRNSPRSLSPVSLSAVYHRPRSETIRPSLPVSNICGAHVCYDLTYLIVAIASIVLYSVCLVLG